MRIEELIIEGFKSYPQRTQITGWDSSFNAITGLNGSGKSNILDAICFVLGMTNMQTMRAGSQADLIYKRGQAGITKASVTIVFDNSENPIPGYQTAQITVTRQFSLPNTTKWLFNGHKSTQQNVLSFFQAVQLNINNPNFLIMQGRITKVLNMRPAETLGMIEEAAGTRMFEEKKDKAKRTMAKKQSRVDEITDMLHKEIEPKLDKLRQEKIRYIEFQKGAAELEKTGRILRAWEYMDYQQKIVEKSNDAENAVQERKEVEAEMKQAQKEGKQAEKDLNEVVKKRDAEMKKGGKLAKLKADADALGKEVVKIRTQAEIKQTTMEEEENKLVEAQATIQALEETIVEETKKLATITAKTNTIKEQHESLNSDVLRSEELLQTLLTGLTSASSKNVSNTGGGYMGQIAEAKARISQGEAEEEQSRKKLEMKEKELEDLKKRMKDFEREAGESRKRLEQMRNTVEKQRQQLGRCKWDKEKEDDLEARLANLKNSVRHLTDKRDHIKHTLSRLNFEYSDPYFGFDRTKIKGYIAQLTKLDQANYDKATALEIAAGGKLFNVVVEDEKVGNALLRDGKLKKRVTMIPLNKIKSYPIDQRKVDAAHRLAPGKVHTAISLVGYTEDIARAMLFVFGSTFICDDAATAKTVTFNPAIHVKSVTLEGDIYDPSGSLSGGSAPSGNQILIDVQKLLEIEGELNQKKRELQEAQAEEERNKGVREAWKGLTRDLEIKEHELKLFEEQVGGSNASRIAADVEDAQKNIQELKDAVQAAKDKQVNSKAEVAKLEKDMKEFKNNKEGKTEELKREIANKKAALQRHNVVLKTQQKEHQTATLELEQQQKDLDDEKSKLDDARAHVSNLKKELVRMSEEVIAIHARHQEAEHVLAEEQVTLSRFDAELKLLEDLVKARKATVKNCEAEIERIEHNVQNIQKEITTYRNKMESHEKIHEWIKHDKHLFGKSGTQYDFELDIEALKAKEVNLQKSQAANKKKVNLKVMDMIDNLEKRESGLKKNLQIVLKDKDKIEKTIENLDQYKREALQKTWQKVNGDFGSIFNELLPGNFAKLQPPEGQELTDGLEVKVQLGKVWKQSLTELSGGQRSLIALSLIMALLQFKPAPMYILDEVDAALDLSHTQNIGHLFRTRFKGSQFIVVSLKEGLFTNANVLFKAKFRDGTSIVERTAQRSTSSLYH